MTDIEAGAAEDAFTLINLIRNADIDTVFGAEQSTSATGDTAFRNKEVLFGFSHSEDFLQS